MARRKKDPAIHRDVHVQDEIGKILPIPGDLDDLADDPTRRMAFVFRSDAMRHLVDVAAQVAGSDAPVLISGESGTGKELFARLIHALSNRKDKPFVPVNCGVLKGELFADKFFGHEAGAFTGAARQQKGSFELAEDGTLFLDEVGEIPQTNQVDFLRVLEQRTFKRLGGERDLSFAARIVAATNRVLPDLVREGLFRADLYYRLTVIPVTLPPLRERVEDVPLLARHFLSLFAARYHKPGLVFAPEALRTLESYPWPGNVRELRNLVERLALLTPEGPIRPEDMPLDMRLEASYPTEPADPECLSLAAAVKAAETRAILRAFAAAGGSKAATAELLRISPRTLRYKLQELQLKLGRG